MKLTEKIKLTTENYGSASNHKREYSLSNKSLDDFIANLNEHGVLIDRNDSEKTVKYHMKNGERTPTVPLDTEFPEGFQPIVVSYLLRGDGLELDLQNYYRCGRTKRIGGSFGGEYGLTCKVTAEGDNIDASVVENVRKALDETYIPPVILSEEEKENLQTFLEQLDGELGRKRRT